MKRAFSLNFGRKESNSSGSRMGRNSFVNGSQAKYRVINLTSPFRDPYQIGNSFVEGSFFPDQANLGNDHGLHFAEEQPICMLNS